MDDETHRLQPDPPEGARDVIDRELERQAERNRRKENPAEPRPAGRPPHETKRPRARA